MSANRNDGKWLEDRVYDALLGIQKSKPAFIYRFYDTRSTRQGAVNSFLPVQPGDFLLLVPNKANLIECKSTNRGAPLQSLLDAAQIGKHKMWQRAKHPTFFIYGDERSDAVALYDGQHVLEVYGQESRRRYYVPALMGNLKDIPDFLLKLF